MLPFKCSADQCQRWSKQPSMVNMVDNIAGDLSYYPVFIDRQNLGKKMSSMWHLQYQCRHLEACLAKFLEELLWKWIPTWIVAAEIHADGLCLMLVTVTKEFHKFLAGKLILLRRMNVYTFFTLLGNWALAKFISYSCKNCTHELLWSSSKNFWQVKSQKQYSLVQMVSWYGKNTEWYAMHVTEKKLAESDNRKSCTGL